MKTRLGLAYVKRIMIRCFAWAALAFKDRRRSEALSGYWKVFSKQTRLYADRSVLKCYYLHKALAIVQDVSVISQENLSPGLDNFLGNILSKALTIQVGVFE